MEAKREIDKAVGQYLEEVAAQLGDMPADEKDDILRDIESHIYAALEKYGPNPTVDDLNVILAGMDRPSSYAPSARQAATSAGSPRFCRLPVLGAAWAPFGVLVTVFYLLAWFHNVGMDGVFYRIYQFVIFPLGITAPFGCTALGLMAVSKIRASGGRLIGMPLAVSIAVLFPVVIADAMVAIGAFTILQELQEPVWVRVLVITASPIVVVALGFVIFRAVWRWANRPLKSGEFT